jgi:hypothetical protein
MNILQKIKLEKTLRRINSTYKYINCGGCGHFAKELGTTLKTKGYEVKYILLLSDEGDVDYANKSIKDNKLDILNNLSWGHVMVNVEDKLIDIEGLCEAKYDKKNKVYKKDRYIGITLPENVLFTWLTPKYDHNWNRAFNRDYIPKIRKELQKSLVD